MKHLLVLTIIIATIFPSLAVTDKEMDEAKATAARLYLRWANNGSGYLDEVSARSMAELTPKLKDKEKENLKAFNAVKIPSDYPTWTKEQFVKYWSETFFASPGLNPDGTRAKGRVKIKLEAMKVSAPQNPQPAAEQPAEQPEQPAMPEQATPGATEAPADSTSAARDNILSDQEAIARDAAEAESQMTPPQQSHTWVYILVLSILAALVIWLVVYAANLMKRQPGADLEELSEDSAKLRDQARQAITKKSKELEAAQQRLRDEEERSAQLGIELEKLKLENRRNLELIEQLREENARLNRNASRTAQAPVRTAPRNTEPTPAAAPKATPKAAPKPEPTEEQPILKVIYLGRANANGIFVRADRRINPGATIFRLDTNDGLVGTFHVVDEPEVVEHAISNPLSHLANGCVCEDFDDTAGVTRIITESAGTAIFENGYWKILRKTRIRYE